MATMVLRASDFHAGEEAVQRRLRVPLQQNPTRRYLPTSVAAFLSSCPFLVLGTLSPNGAPWVSLVGGERGFVRGVGEGLITLKAGFGIGDPLAENLKMWEGMVEEEGARMGEGMVSGLGINLETRSRWKFFGRSDRTMRRILETPSDGGIAGERAVAMVLNIVETVPNCPKYITTRKLRYYKSPTPSIHPSPLPLPPAALDLISTSDIFFVASRNAFETMDANHRGGPPGFVRVLHNDLIYGTAIVWPEYSGNRLYQTLGNFQTTPLAGVTIPDFSTGHILYLSGTVEILIGKAADELLPRSNLVVKMTVTAARFVQGGLGIRGEIEDFSPYNPPVRFLPTERPDPVASAKATAGTTAKLIGVKKLTPTVARFTFRLRDALGNPAKSATWRAGQYVALSFKEELSVGYRHMDDFDPTGLNDDYSRTFTVSSPPPPSASETQNSKKGEFEMTIKKVGPVTEFLFQASPRRRALEIPVLGFGGEFAIDRSFLTNPAAKAAFIAGGVGITPFLAQFPTFTTEEKAGVELFWCAKAVDVPLLQDILSPAPASDDNRFHGLASLTSIFITGVPDVDQAASLVDVIRGWGVKSVNIRRLQRDDLMAGREESAVIQRRWYLCANKGLSKEVLKWLDGEEVLFEDFGY